MADCRGPVYTACHMLCVVCWLQTQAGACRVSVRVCPTEMAVAIHRLEMPTWVLVVISITNDMSAMFTSFDKVNF